MYYTVYKITNLVNNKIYIGTHKTHNINDEYFGSGKILKRAIEKHGIENFKKEILYIFDNPQDMFDKEKELVNEKFVAKGNTYNIKKGGHGGFDYCNTDEIIKRRAWTWETGVWSKAGTEAFLNKLKTDDVFRQNHSKHMRKIAAMAREKNIGNTNWVGRKHKEESKQKMSEAAKERTGSKNSSYGKSWYHHPETLHNVKRKPNEVPDGYVKGRRLKPYNKCMTCGEDTGSFKAKYCVDHRKEGSIKAAKERAKKLEVYSEDGIIEAVKRNKNLRQTCLDLGMKVGGRDYQKIKDVMEKFDLKFK